MKLWLTHRTGTDNRSEFQGVFDTEDAARAACREDPYWSYWYAPAELNVELPHESAPEWLGAVVPFGPSPAMAAMQRAERETKGGEP